MTQTPRPTVRRSQPCPDVCPRCGFDLKGDGYPQGHQNDNGNPCSFRWSMVKAISRGPIDR